MTDGYGVTWGTIFLIPSKKLFEIGTTIDLSLDDFKSFAANRVINVNEACEILNCSRQNINNLIKRGVLNSIKSRGKSIALMKNEVIQRKWGRNVKENMT